MSDLPLAVTSERALGVTSALVDLEAGAKDAAVGVAGAYIVSGDASLAPWRCSWTGDSRGCGNEWLLSERWLPDLGLATTGDWDAGDVPPTGEDEASLQSATGGGGGVDVIPASHTAGARVRAIRRAAGGRVKVAVGGKGAFGGTETVGDKTWRSEEIGGEGVAFTDDTTSANGLLIPGW